MSSFRCSPAELHTFSLLCETLIPSLPIASDNEAAAFYALSAQQLDLVQQAITALGTIPSAQQDEFRRLLWALEQPWAMRLLGATQPFSALDLAARERVLQRMADSPLRILRKGFQALKRLVGFLFLSSVDSSGDHPAWPLLGYKLPPPVLEHPPAVTVTPITAATHLAADVCIVGSGAGGGVVAATLAQGGWRVVVLEAGSATQASGFDHREVRGMRGLYLDHGLTSTDDLSVSILAGGTLGGGTTVNWQTSLRPPDHLRDEWAARTGFPFFTTAAFSDNIDRVSTRLGVTTAETIVYPNNMALAVGATRLGYHADRLPRNARDCDPERCGFCVFGCPTGGKQGMLHTYLADAQAVPDPATLITNCRVDRVCIENGRATGVHATATDPTTGARHAVTVHAPRVVVAAGALHSPAVLLRSGCTLPALGRNLHLHPTTAMAGVYNARLNPWAGPPQSIYSNEFGHLHHGYGFKLETAPAHLGLIGMSTPWFNAQSYRRELLLSPYKAVTIVLSRDQAGGRVTLDRDGRPRIHYALGATERQNLRHGMVEAARIHLAAGAQEVLTLHTRPIHLQRGEANDAAAVERFYDRIRREPVDDLWLTLFSAHQMSTCRMGSDPRTAVCDENGAVWGVRGLYVADTSLFPTASGVNPMITVLALAQHVADQMVAAS